ncbi:phosphate signaling complex protein PhoU [Corynebacterium heidelbergense]|uniref:Phosphate-specific transport system accessory protein PhoU n=1 Tax=Corynebacterium heidelbergense TaxID=2055947 RepID=A0A364V800_9CORY|nr:phosphate signaling complex protein PhoU [Corynebacterium heidelbergense]RAV32775.1 phosphate transport system regulatory protein PhoU [Corynebacterium heidelbergense]
MRANYRDELSKFTQDLLIMGDYVQSMLEGATQALLTANLAQAEQVLSRIDNIEDLRDKAESAAFSILALEAPVAGELRRIVSGLYIVESFARMGALAVHVAKIARRRHPSNAVPENVRPYIAEMARLDLEICGKIHEILIDTDATKAMEVARDDDAVDDLHHHIFHLTTQRPWPHSTTAAVDITLLSRFLERFSDHAVDIAARVVYMVTGMQPNQYQAAQRTREQNEAVRQQFDEISRRYEGSPFD